MKMIMKIIKRPIAFVVILLVLGGCETEEQRDLFRAQQCINQSSSSNVENCRSYLSGHASKEAYVLQCSIDFLKQGVTASRMATAIEKRDSSTTNKNSLLGMMGMISFSDQQDLISAERNCSLCGYSSYTMLIKMAKISTTLVVDQGVPVTVDNKPDQKKMEEVVAAVVASPTSEIKETVGAAAQTIQTSYCTAENATSKVCTTIAESISAGDSNEEIGQKLLALFNK
ncbi:MAG: hypothetical protein HQK53_03895 [Oligoflexia bacterium]|nr:hypothetical protein [Oligoflexia bacterium]